MRRQRRNPVIASVSHEFRLADDDLRLVQDFERKLQIVRDRVNSVVHLYHTAAYFVGRPGTSKTFTVKKELQRLEAPWEYRNARMTPMGLFDFIAAHPEHILVLDDISTLFKNEQALQILMAALDGDPANPGLSPTSPRTKTWLSGLRVALSPSATYPSARTDSPVPLNSRVTSLGTRAHRR